MKTLFQLILLAMLVSLSGCKSTPTKVDSTGAAYDVLVVMPDTLWFGPAGDTLQSILAENPMILPQPEPLHSVIHANSEQVNRLLLRHRNVILFQPGKQEQPSMTVEYNVYSQPQALVRIAGPSAAVMTDYMAANRFALQGIFDMAERDRTVDMAARFVDREIRDTILDRFGLRIDIPRGYRIRYKRPDFMRVSYETPLWSQGLIIYKYPLTGRLDSAFTRASLLENRDRFVRAIEGPNEGSYMRTADHVVMPEFSMEVIAGRRWFELSGLWDLENGFMGGPFISYSTLNTTTGEVLTVDLYVYSPKNPKRNYLKYLEGLMHTARIPGDTTGHVPRTEAMIRHQTDTITLKK
jgi:hypothetical protein